MFTLNSPHIWNHKPEAVWKHWVASDLQRACWVVSLNSSGYFVWRSPCCRAFQSFNPYLLKFGWFGHSDISIIFYPYIHCFLPRKQDTSGMNKDVNRYKDTKIQRRVPIQHMSRGRSQLVFMVAMNIHEPMKRFTCCMPRSVEAN